MRYIPMINEKDILTRLQAGEDAQKIADELAAVLNAANATYIAEQKAKEEAARKAEAEKAAKEEERNELAQIIADAVMDYIELVAPELVQDEEEELSGEEVRKLLDSMIPLMQSMKNLQAIMPAGTNPFGTPILTPPVAKMGNGTSIVKMSDDEIIKNFLNKNVH